MMEFGLRGWGRRGILVGDNEMDSASFTLENLVRVVEFSAARDDAAQRLFLGREFGRNGHRHLVGFQGAATHKNGIGALPNA